MREVAPTVWPKEKRFAFCWGPRKSIFDESADPSCNAKEGNPFGPFWDYSGIEFIADEYYSQKIEAGHDLARRFARKAWNENFPPSDFPVLAFVSAPSAFPAKEEDRHLQKYLKFRPRITDKAIKFIKENLPRPFVGIHLRNHRDWDNVCRPLKEGQKMDHLFAGIEFIADEYYSQKIEAGHDLARRFARKAWNENFPPSDFPVLAFVSAPSAFPAKEEDRHLQKYLKFRPRITDKAIKFIKENLPRPFVGIHLRNHRDWDNVCRPLKEGQKMDHLFASPQCLGLYNEYGVLTSEICSPSEETVLNDVEEVVNSIRAKSVFVSSDKDHMIPELNDRLKSRNVSVHKLSDDDPTMATSLAGKVSIVAGDITELEVDAIVNAANSSLLGGGGVDGAIHRAAGKDLLRECEKLGGCYTGEAKITKAYNIKNAKAIIHTVGPRAHHGVTEDTRAQLANCYFNSLRLAAENNLRTVAFPCISTGIYAYPQEDAAEVATDTVKSFLESPTYSGKIDKVIFCVFGEKDRTIYESLVSKKFS
uniref:GDP-fucose protein O-fucosyltransferase 1 n=1 Tax=Panagrolaimus sp. JU765 TaxID=591449 RepID=A0AC34RDD3_9BILA